MEDAFHKGIRMSQFVRNEIKAKKELKLKTPGNEVNAID